jgi:hypothetical protein
MALSESEKLSTKNPSVIVKFTDQMMSNPTIPGGSWSALLRQMTRRHESSMTIEPNTSMRTPSHRCAEMKFNNAELLESTLDWNLCMNALSWW